MLTLALTLLILDLYGCLVRFGGGGWNFLAFLTAAKIISIYCTTKVTNPVWIKVIICYYSVKIGVNFVGLFL